MNAFEKYGKLRVEGTSLLSKDGEKVQLKGPSTLGLVWYPDFINKEAFETIHSWGASLIRLAMYTQEEDGYLTPEGDQEFTKGLIDKGVRYASELGMYVIIDWHILSDGNPKASQDEAVRFFDEMSLKYKDNDNVIYEICNEPNGDDVTWSVVKSYAETVIPVIRKNSPDSIILVGTPKWSQLVDDAADDPIKGYQNIMYSLHYYAASHKEELRNKLRYALSKELPVFIDEYSICDASGNGGLDYDEAKKWAKIADENMISYAQWSISPRDESAAMVKASCKKLSGWTDDDLTETGLWMKDRLSGKISYL